MRNEWTFFALANGYSETEQQIQSCLNTFHTHCRSVQEQNHKESHGQNQKQHQVYQGNRTDPVRYRQSSKIP